MATLAEMKIALVNAHNAGDQDAARKLAAFIAQAQPDLVNQIPGTQVPGTLPGKPEQTIADKAIGVGETALAAVTGATGGLAGQVAGTLKGLAESILNGSFGTPEAAREVAKSAEGAAGAMTYAPRTPAGQEMTAALGETIAPLTAIAPMLNVTQALARGAVQAAPAVTAVAGRGAQAIKTGAGKAAEAVQDITGTKPSAGGSVGAQGVDMATLRQEKALGLPVPVKLTEGAKTRAAPQLAFEKEQIKSAEFGAPLRARQEQNNLQVLQNIESLIDDTGSAAPDLAASGSRLVKTLSDGYKAAKNKTNVAYRKARDSAEARAPVNTGQVVRIGEGPNEVAASVVSYLNDKATGVRGTEIPDAARKYAVRMGIADEANGSLVPRTATVGQMEDFRRALSGLAKYDDAVGIREETILKKLIDAQTEPVAGPLYKNARAIRTAQARKFENRAIIGRLLNNKRGTDDAQVPMDRVFNQTILNSSPEEITFLKRVLSTTGKAGREAWSDIEAETLKFIRDEATKGMGMDSADKPIVSTAKLHNAVNRLDANGRLDIVLGKQRAQILRDLNDVVRYVNTVPPGTLINSSGTAGALLAAVSEATATGALTGLPVPVVSTLRLVGRSISDAKIKAKIKNALGE